MPRKFDKTEWQLIRHGMLREAMPETQTSLRNRAQMHDAQHPDTSETIHQFDDGWTVRRPKTNADHWRETSLMSNCVDDRCELTDDPSDPHLIPDSNYYSLRDPDNVPHVSWEDGGYDPALGRHNSPVKEKYRPYLDQLGIEYADALCEACDQAKIEGQPCQLCERQRTAMANQTGNRELDSLIEEYLYENSFQKSVGDPAFEGEEAFTPDIHALIDMATPEKAQEMCSMVSNDFDYWLNMRRGRGFNGESEVVYNNSPEALGYGDRSISGLPQHSVVKVTMGPDEIYLVDFTASQYGYKDFPLVQKLEGEQWQREWPGSYSDDSFRDPDFIGREPNREEPNG